MSMVIASAGLVPSNRNAGFPNLARHDPFSEEDIKEVTETCLLELIAAGIKPYVFTFMAEKGEVPTLCIGGRSLWSFKRRWYYYIREQPYVPGRSYEATAISLSAAEYYRDMPERTEQEPS